MIEEVEIQEPEQQEPDPPKKKLWRKLNSGKLYTKSYADFEQQFNTPERIGKLYQSLSEKKLYTKTAEEFNQQFFTTEKKKLVGKMDFGESSLQAGNALSNGVGGEEIPTIELYTTPQGEMVEANPIALSKKYTELLGRKKESTIIGGSSFGMGTTTSQSTDDDAVKSAKKLQEDFPYIDFEGISEELKDIPDEVLQRTGNELMQDREQNNPLYQRKLANIKWRSGFEKQLLDYVDNGFLKPEEYNNIKHGIEQLPISTGEGNFTNQRSSIKSMSDAIRLFGGEKKDEILKNFAVEVSKVYGNAYDNKFSDSVKDSPESKYLNEDEQLGLQFLKDVDPDKAKQYERILVDPKTYKDNPDAVKGANHLHQVLEETSLGLQQNAVTEEMNNLSNIAKRNEGLTPEQLQQAEKLEKRQEEINVKRNELDKKYPERKTDKVSDAVNEIMGHDLNWGEYAMVKTGQALTNTGKGIWEAVSSPFMSDQSNSLRELEIMGESITDEKNLKQPDKNKALQYDKLVIEPDLQKQVDEIKNDKSLNEEQKRSKLFSLFYDNTDKFGRVPIQNGKWNINPSSILYGLTDLATTLVPFIGLEAVTGGIGGVGAGAKFLRTFTAAAATTFHDEYAAAIQEGKPQSEAYKRAMYTTAINSAAMAGAGTPTEIRAMLGSKSSAAKIIARLSDAEIKKVMAEGTPKGLRAIGQSLKNRVKATPALIGQGLKTGAKFETAMAGAAELTDREHDWKQAVLSTANFGLLGGGLGHIGYKSPTELQKGGMLEMGKNGDGFRATLDEMKKNGQLNEAEFAHRKDLIDKSEEAYKVLPKANDKGQPLDEKQKAEYIYNSVIKNEGKKAAVNLPPKQAEKAEITAMAADHANDLILDPKTDKQLESRKSALEKSLEKKDENGKLELTDTERKNAQAELQAINNEVDTRKSFEKVEMKRRDIEPKLSVPIEGVNEKGIPTGEDVPAETNPEVNAGNTSDVNNKTGKKIEPTEGTGISVEEPRQVPQPIPLEESKVSVQPPMEVPEPIKLNEPNEETQTEVHNPETITITPETEPIEVTQEAGTGEGKEGEWTHINKKDITDAEELANKHPFGESESWKNSVKKGLEKLAKVAKKGESLYDAAKNKVSDWAAKVKQEILDDGKSTFNPSDEEISQMAYHRTMTNKRIADLEPDLTSPIQAVRDAAEIVLSDLEAQKEMVDYVLHNTATTAGRAFNIRQMISKIDSENGLQTKRMDIIRKQKGQPLSEKQEQELRDIHDEEVKNQKAKDEYAKKKTEKDFEEAVKAEVDRRAKAKKDKAATDKKDKAPTEKRTKIADKLNDWADKFEKFGKADLPEGTVKKSLAPDVQKMVSNAMRFVAEGVRNGKNIPEILKEAVKKFGESVLEHIKGGLRDIGITDREIEGDRQYALNKIKELAEKEKSDMLTKSAVGKGLVRELANAHIDNGLTGKDVFTELNKDLKEIFPEITEQQVRDAYLKEGEFTLDKKENINKAKFDAKNELRSIAKNETDIADLKAERDLRKREREERQKTNYENQLIAEKKGLTDKKALTEKQEKRLVELNKELDRIKQRKAKDAKVSNPKDLNRSDKEKAVLDEIKNEKEQWAKEKQAQRDLDIAAKKAQTVAKNEAERLKALTEKRDKLEKGQRDSPTTSVPKVESPAIEQVKAEIKEADKKLREAESEANRLNKEIQSKKDKLAEHEANIKRAEKGLESIKTNRKKSDKQIDTDISDAEKRLQKELNKQGLKLEKGSKAEKEQKQKVANKHNERVDKVIERIDTKLQDATLTANEKAALENAKKILEKSKINPDSALDIFDAVDKAEKNTELARTELANSEKLADIKKEITSSQIQMGRDKLETEQDILLQRHKDSLQKKIDENERRLDAGEYVEKEPARLKKSDAESIKLEIKDRETKNKLNAVGQKAQREAMTKREKVIDTLQSLYVIGLVGRLSTLAKVGVSALTKQPLNTITSQTFGRLGGVVFPKIKNALRGEGNEGWRKEKNRYMAHYGALGKEGMAKLINKGKVNAQKADEAYINAKDKLEDIANKYGKDSKQYKDFEKGEFKKAENAQKQALLDNVTNSIYEWIGGNSWADAAEVFLHSSAKLEQLLGKGEKEMWSDKTRKEKIMFVLSTSAATHGVLKNFSARAEFAANFVARLENKMKQDIDISSAEEILKTINESYIAFQRGKYQEDNAITGGFKAGLDGLRIWAEKHPDYKYAADLMAGALKFKNPIVRTPLNIAREAIVEYTIGVPLAIAKYKNSLRDAKVDAKQFDLAGQEMKNHMKKFMDNIPADKADFIYRAFRKGGFGLGVMALTAMGGIKFGGFFNRDEKRRKNGDDLGVNEIEIGGEKLTHLEAKIFEHTSAFFPALLWSNYDRVRKENLKSGDGEVVANLDATVKDFQGMMDMIPIGNEIQNPLQGIQLPLIGPFLSEYAEATDVDANGEPIKRKPKGNILEKTWQNAEMKIPGLRTNVPKSGKDSKFDNFTKDGKELTDKDIQEFEKNKQTLIDQNLEKLKKNGIGDTKYKDLTPEEITKEETYIKTSADNAVKASMFIERTPTREEIIKDTKKDVSRFKNYDFTVPRKKQ